LQVHRIARHKLRSIKHAAAIRVTRKYVVANSVAELGPLRIADV